MPVRLFASIVVAISLSGCTSTTYMKDPATGMVGTCGNVLLEFPLYAAAASTGHVDCVRAYVDRGYMKLPEASDWVD